MENNMTNVQSPISAENEVWREYRIVEDCKQQEDTRAFIYGSAKVMMDLYNSGRERRAKRIANLLHEENVELSRIRETMMDISECIRFLCDASNES